MKILFGSEKGFDLGFAWRLVKEGHKIKFCIFDPEFKNVGDGFVQKVDDWNIEKDWADIIVIEDSDSARDLRKNNYKVWGGLPDIPVSPKDDSDVSIFVCGLFKNGNFIEPIGVGFTEGSSITMAWTPKRRIYEKTLGEIAPILKQANYNGFVCGYGSFNPKSISIHKWSCVMPANVLESFKGNLGDILNDSFTPSIQAPYSSSMVISSQDSIETEKPKNVIFRLKNKQGIWPLNVVRDISGKWKVVGSSCVIVTGHGPSLSEASEMIYRRAKTVLVPGGSLPHRNGYGLKEKFDLLLNGGWFA